MDDALAEKLDEASRWLSKLDAWTDQHIASGRPATAEELEILAKIRAGLPELRRGLNALCRPPTPVDQ